MFGDKKIKPEKVDLTLSELIEKYVDRNYVNVDYKANGTVSVWITPVNKEERRLLNECTDQGHRDAEELR